jgi:hypothetical protein
MPVDVRQIKDQVTAKTELVHRLTAEIGKVIVGQENMISRLLIGLLTHGHVLLEGVPGLEKPPRSRPCPMRFRWISNASSSPPICSRQT